MNLKEMNLDQLIAERERTVDYIAKAKDYQSEVESRLMELLTVPDGQQSKVHTVGDYKITREEKMEYKLDPRALKDFDLTKIPKGVISEKTTKSLSLTRMKEELAEYGDEIMKIVKATPKSSISFKKVEEK